MTTTPRLPTKYRTDQWARAKRQRLAHDFDLMAFVLLDKQDLLAQPQPIKPPARSVEELVDLSPEAAAHLRERLHERQAAWQNSKESRTVRGSLTDYGICCCPICARSRSRLVRLKRPPRPERRPSLH